MSADPSKFHVLNVTDTCAIWNLLSSRLLYSRAVAAHCFFSCTHFVEYECLYKARKSSSPQERELRERMEREQRQGQFKACSIEIEDLQQIGHMRGQRRVSFGELSSIAFAKRTGQAFLTDDQRARKLAHMNLEAQFVQTTPHLFGWLIFTGVLNDSDKEQVLVEHVEMGRPLYRYFAQMYVRAVEQRLASVTRTERSPS